MGSSIEITVIGGGIAGASAAASLQNHPSAPQVRLIEAESTLAYHTTGRSAAQLIENYGTEPIRALTKAGLDFFDAPPDGLTDHPLLSPQGLLTVATSEQAENFEQEAEAGLRVNPRIEVIDPDKAAGLFKALRYESIQQALWEPDSRTIDVANLHQAYIRWLRRAGGHVQLERRATALTFAKQRWRIETADGGDALGADLIVNAAGAWGDEVAAMAGLAPVNLAPLRRTAFMVKSDHGGSGSWPLLADIDHNWYVKPDGAQFLCSPADETPSAPCDAKPFEIDVAMAIDRINTATTLDIVSVASSWAGLRTFAPDRNMVIGPDPEQSQFIWLVGQGGTGIQTSPAAGRLVRDLAIDGAPSQIFDEVGLDHLAFDPGRFR